MLFLAFFLFLLPTVVYGFAPLRKHHYKLESPIDEQEFIHQHLLNTSTSTTSKSEACGEARLSCMAFSYSSTIPIRCGVLKNAPLCESIDTATNRVKCNAFCDTDGGGRLCEKAFPTCCQRSVHGCTSSQPRNIVLYHH